MKVLVIGPNYAPEPIGVAVYTTALAEALVVRGHGVVVIAAQPYYPEWKAQPYRRGRSVENGVGVSRVPIYVPANPTGARRLVHHLSFAAAAMLPAIRQRPDVVVAIAPSLAAAPVALLAAKLAGAPAWLHVQDFELDAAMATGLLGGAGRVAASLERAIFRRFHRVSSISAQMCGRLVDKGVPFDGVTELRNGADLRAIRPLEAPSALRKEWGLSAPIMALYSGSLGAKQDVSSLIEAARLLARRDDIALVICGEGPNRAALEAAGVGLSNLRFHDLLPREQLNDLLNLADVHLLPQLAGAADLVLPSKLANMLASGRPVIAAAEEGTGLADEVAGAGLLVAPGDATGLAQAIARLADDAALRRALGANARRKAEARWSMEAQHLAFELHLLALVAERSPAALQLERA